MWAGAISAARFESIVVHVDCLPGKADDLLGKKLLAVLSASVPKLIASLVSSSPVYKDI